MGKPKNGPIGANRMRSPGFLTHTIVGLLVALHPINAGEMALELGAVVPHADDLLHLSPAPVRHGDLAHHLRRGMCENVGAGAWVRGCVCVISSTLARPQRGIAM